MAPLQITPLRRTLSACLLSLASRAQNAAPLHRTARRSLLSPYHHKASPQVQLCHTRQLEQQRRFLTTQTTTTTTNTTDTLPHDLLEPETEREARSEIVDEPTAAALGLTSTPEPQRSSTTTPLSETLQRTLPLLHLQAASASGTSLYATLHIHARPYLVTLGDRIRLPFAMPAVEPGDILRLTRASTLGTRDYTLRGAPWVAEQLFEARAVVAGVESEPMRTMEKTKRRVRKIKRVTSKHRYTELLVTELKLGPLRGEPTGEDRLQDLSQLETV